jgi:hypothetical protein
MRAVFKESLFLGLCLAAAGVANLLAAPQYIYGAYCGQWTCTNPSDGTFYSGKDFWGNTVAQCYIQGINNPFYTCLYGSGGPCPAAIGVYNACAGVDYNNQNNSCWVTFYDCGSH